MSGGPPHVTGRRVRLLLAVIGAVVGGLLTGATGAFGYWLAMSDDNPSLATADTLPKGATPALATPGALDPLSPNSKTVYVTFAAASTSPGNVAIPAGQYTLRRYPAAGDPVPVTATCSGVTTITCTESNVPDGSWQYTDTPTYGLNWVGDESEKSAPVVVDTTPPVVPVPSVTAGYVTALSVPVGVGTVTDSGSGVSTSGVLRASAALSGGTCGAFGSFTEISLTDGSDTSVLSNTCYQYQQQATDNVGNTTTSTPSNTVKVDNTAPTVPAPAVTAGYVITSTVPVALGTVTDAGSGVNTSGVLRASAALSGGTCGPFDSFTAVSLTAGTDTTVLSDTCYQYQQQATDNAGNVGTSTTSNTVKVDTTAPPVPTLTHSTLSNVSVTGTNVYYRSTASSGGFTVTASSTDSESGIASYSFPSLGTGWTFTGSGATRTYSWSGTNPTTSSGGLAVTATNNAGQTSSGSNATNPITMVSDTTAPTVAVPSVTAGYVTALSVPVGVGTVTDSGSGVSTSGVLRASAALSGGTCGAFGSFTEISLTDGSDTSVLSNTCYQYQQQATDNVGNTTTSTPIQHRQSRQHCADVRGHVPGRLGQLQQHQLGRGLHRQALRDSQRHGQRRGPGAGQHPVQHRNHQRQVLERHRLRLGHRSQVPGLPGRRHLDPGLPQHQLPRRRKHLHRPGLRHRHRRKHPDHPHHHLHHRQHCADVRGHVPGRLGQLQQHQLGRGLHRKLCGTASDTGSGVAQVQVSIQSNTGTTSGKYWNGTAFASGTEVKSPASLAGGTWTLAFPSTNFPADGSTYTVRAYATDTAGNTQTTPTTTFTIDNTAPTSAVTFPVASGSYNNTSWAAGCTAKLCGTASDTGSGVAQVQVSIQSNTGTTSGKYWNGTAFASGTEVKSPASLAGGTWTLAFPSTNFPADGSTYTVRAYATDTAGNTQTTPTTTFTIDATAPTITGLTLAGGTARKIEWGDTITITFSEQMRASTLCSSWTTGADSDIRNLSSNVSVAIGNGTAPATGNDYLTVTATGCSFGTLDLGSNQYVTGAVTFSNSGGNGSAVEWNGSTSTLTITLGKVASGATRIRANVPNSSPTYGNSSIRDSAGNPLSTPSFTLPSGPQF